MNICGHIISTSQIIGIGPLMVKDSTDQTTRLLYNSKQLFFLLHLKNQSVEIKSEWFQVGVAQDRDDFYMKQRDLYNQFKAQYDTAKAAILEVIDEVVTN